MSYFMANIEYCLSSLANYIVIPSTRLQSKKESSRGIF